MIKRFKKSISYLLVAMLVFPTCLISWLTKATIAEAALLPEVSVNSQTTSNQTPYISGSYISVSKPDSIKVILSGIEYLSPTEVHVQDDLTWHVHGNKIKPSLEEGIYNIIVVMRINDIEVTDKTQNELTIDRTDPTVIDVSSLNEDGAYSNNQKIYISIKFSEKVKVSGAPYIKLALGSDRKAYYHSGSSTDTLIFYYTLAASDTSLHLDYTDITALRWSSMIEDLAGNDAELTLPQPGLEHSLGYNKAIIVDNTVPEITITAPTEDEKVNGGTKYVISWTADDSESKIKEDSILIEYKRGDDDWVEIVKNAANSGTFEWLTPIIDPEKNDVAVRITAFNKAGLSNRVSSGDFSIYDYDSKPVITLKGDNPMAIVKGSTFTDPGSVVTDNYPGTYEATVTGSVDTSTVGEYYLKYYAKDARNIPAEQVTRTVKVVAIAPTFTVAQTDGKNFIIKFNGVGNGVTSYQVYVNNVPISISAYNNGEDSNHEYLSKGSVLEYGKSYSVYIIAYGPWGNVKSDEKSITISEPASSSTTGSSASTSSTSRSASIVSSAQAAESTESTVTPPASSETPPNVVGDENGKIKGEDETEESEEEDKVNWTPWIVLFILIILAGAATGGYFYWFAGEEDTIEKNKKPVAPVAKEEKKEKPETKSTAAGSGSGKSGKKSRRW